MQSVKCCTLEKQGTCRGHNVSLPGLPPQITEMIQAFKNLALLGALLVIASTPRRARMKL